MGRLKQIECTSTPAQVIRMHTDISLSDKYTASSGRIFVTGIQALVRLALQQRRLDQSGGLNTAGYISGYRGSPLGSFDQQLWQAKEFLNAHEIVFQPGINEDLAATAIWGTQQAELNGEGKYDGVFAMWYGKGPGVDRSGDAFRHANLAGTSRYGGVLAALGDDHACESSTTAHQSEFALVDAMMPVLNPASVQDILDFGLVGWQLSRFSGCWVGLKCVHDTVEATASIELMQSYPQPLSPKDFGLPAAGLNIRLPDTPLEQEQRLHQLKLPAVHQYWRENSLDRLIFDSPDATVGIITTGKSYSDVRRALTELHIDQAEAARLGLRLYKLALSWPIEPEGLLRFAKGLQRIIVIEEKRPLVEDQVKTLLYGCAQQPSVVGKFDDQGQSLLPSTARLEALQIARAIGSQLLRQVASEPLQNALHAIESVLDRTPVQAPMQRMPYFCAGCPHNTSTKVPQDSIALAGIGCHYMVQWMDRSTARYTQMGAEGASWIGESRFSKREHVFQNIGDGTYLHSGIMAIRAAVAAATTMTFKVLYNDAVAMTGGQPMDGPLTVGQIAHQLIAEGVRKVVVVTDDVEKCRRSNTVPPDVKIEDRSHLDAVQREIREISGVTAIIYDQTCAAEKRRRRKRGEYPDPAKRVFINAEVCEGCGDCGVQSNCVAILPHATEFGRKRRIDQSACNKDYSCINGFCPSFVTVNGGGLRKPAAADAGVRFDSSELPPPVVTQIEREYCIVINGAGGTGVITVGAVLGMAAHIANLGCSVLDMLGLAQKGGAVMSNLIIAKTPRDISSMHVARGGADLVIGGDLVVSASEKILDTIKSGKTSMIVNSYEMMSGDFTRMRDLEFPGKRLQTLIKNTAGASQVTFVNANRYAESLFGNTLAANLFLVGIAIQKGLVPIPLAAIEKAIELNGRSVPMNLLALHRGRQFAAEPQAVEAAVSVQRRQPPALGSSDLDEMIARWTQHLTEYQDAAYARRYQTLVEAARKADRCQAPGMKGLTEAVAVNYARVLAFKDEYEVARQLSSAAFQRELKDQFSGDFTLEYHLAPPVFAKKDAVTGLPVKRTFGPWVGTVLRLVAKLKFLRGRRLDPFAGSADRKLERRLIDLYEQVVREVIADLSVENYPAAVELAAFPDTIRGYGHVKKRSFETALGRLDELRVEFRSGGRSSEAA